METAAVGIERFDPAFEAAYEKWMAAQIRGAKGERKRRLASGLGYAEKLFLAREWWPAFRSFDGLYAEFEVYDFKDGTRFIDFAYIKGRLRIAIEIDPFGTHVRDVDRWRHSDNLDRQNDLVIDDWRVLRFALDKIKEKPRQIQQTLQHALGKWLREAGVKEPAAENPIDAAILSLLANRGEPMSPSEITRELGWHRATILRHLRNMTLDGLVVPAKKGTKKSLVTKGHPAKLDCRGERLSAGMLAGVRAGLSRRATICGDASGCTSRIVAECDDLRGR